MVSAGSKILDIGEAAIALAAWLCDIAAVAEVVDVVLETPGAAGIVCEFGVDLAGDDLPGIALSLDERRAVVVADLALTEVVERVVVACEVEMRT